MPGLPGLAAAARETPRSAAGCSRGVRTSRSAATTRFQATQRGLGRGGCSPREAVFGRPIGAVRPPGIRASRGLAAAARETPQGAAGCSRGVRISRSAASVTSGQIQDPDQPGWQFLLASLMDDSLASLALLLLLLASFACYAGARRSPARPRWRRHANRARGSPGSPERRPLSRGCRAFCAPDVCGAAPTTEREENAQKPRGHASGGARGMPGSPAATAPPIVPAGDFDR